MAGYRELEHTADWELEAWADDLPGLLEQVARGMYALSGAKLTPGADETLILCIQAMDAESLVVRFLSELLYLTQQKGLGFSSYSLQVDQKEPDGSLDLQATLVGGLLLSVDKEIKAVTYHNLAVRRQAGELRVNVVFDV
jgi:SHS2 domain-containing protein